MFPKRTAGPFFICGSRAASAWLWRSIARCDSAIKSAVPSDCVGYLLYIMGDLFSCTSITATRRFRSQISIMQFLARSLAFWEISGTTQHGSNGNGFPV